MRFQDGRETTVSNRHLAPIGRQGEGELIGITDKEKEAPILTKESDSSQNESLPEFTTPLNSPLRETAPNSPLLSDTPPNLSLRSETPVGNFSPNSPMTPIQMTLHPSC